MNFLRLKINTGQEEFEVKYQASLINTILMARKFFIITISNKEVTSYLEANYEEIVKEFGEEAVSIHSEIDSAIRVSPEFITGTCKGVSLSIINCEVREIKVTVKEDTEFAINSKWTHKKYGDGHIVKDKEGMCNKDEVMFYADDSFPFPNVDPNAEYTGWTNLTKVDIVNKKDLEKRCLKK